MCRDKNDDHLIELMRAEARVLVSGDRAVLDVDAPPVRVVTPKEFLDLLERE